MSTLIKGGLLALPHGETRADLLIEGEKIAAIGPALKPNGAEVFGAEGLIVLPGAIDTHTHFDLPVSGTVTADDFYTGTRAAILGGTTTVLDFATQDRGKTLREAYEAWRERMDGRAHCDVGFHMAVTGFDARTEAEVADMAALGITSFKLYMAYPTLMVEDDAILRALKAIRKVGGIAGFHCENGRLVEALKEELAANGQLGPAAHTMSRPAEVEAEAISRLLTIARLAGAPVNIVHLSSEMGLSAVRQGRATGQRVFAETCPQYLLLEDSLYGRLDGAKYVCSPPLRKRRDREALWEALAAGEIDTIGTDHCSFDYERQKAPMRGDFRRIPNGLPGVEHRLSLMMTEGVIKGRVSLSALVRLLSENPARLFGLYPHKGVLRVGSDADLVLWDPAGRSKIEARSQAQNVDYTPYEGMEISGGVRAVWLRGTQAVDQKTLLRPHLGHYLHRNPPFDG